MKSMTRRSLRTATTSENAEVAIEAQRLYDLADTLIMRAEHLRDAAEELVEAAHLKVHLWSDHSDIPTRRPLHTLGR
jgi:hypothetical protein